MSSEIPQVSDSQKVAQSSGSNFISSFFFLPEEKRKAMSAVYAFCRLTDDIVDVGEDKGRPRDLIFRELEDWRESTLRACDGTIRPEDPAVLKELAPVAARFKIPREHFLGLIEGCKMDLEKKSYDSFNELYQYAYRVASLVGLMCLEIFEYRDPRSKQFAVDLGIAFQLTNILRDVKTDLSRGRVYIPKEDLFKFGLMPGGFESFVSGKESSREEKKKFEDLMRFEIERAESYYQKAQENLKTGDRKNLVAAEVMTAVYHSILKEIRRRPSRVLEGKIRVSAGGVLFKIAAAWAFNRLGI